jgi:hypothetical protein
MLVKGRMHRFADGVATGSSARGVVLPGKQHLGRPGVSPLPGRQHDDLGTASPTRIR